MSEPVIIVGGGILGCSTAYWISQLDPQQKILVIDMEGIACSASGKAGGFLARGWHGGGVTKQLHTVGFDLIEEFATTHHLESYRKIPMFSVEHSPRARGANDLPWLNNQVTCSASDPSTAQITPRELTEAFLREAGSNTSTRIGTKVVGVTLVNNKVENIKVEDSSGSCEVLPCSKLIICTGAWTGLVNSWFQDGPHPPPITMQGIKSTSIIYNKIGGSLSDQVKDSVLSNPGVLFCSDDDNGCHLEVYPRPDGQIYICGCGGSPTLKLEEIKKLLPATVEPNISKAKLAHKGFIKMTQQHNGLPNATQEPDIMQACLRPSMSDGLPLMGPLVMQNGQQLDNVFVNSGHNCWGILWSAVSGKAIAELVIHGKATTINLDPFHPRRLVKKKTKHR